MKENCKKALLVYAENWLNRTHIGRTEEEKQAYLNGLEDALTAVYEDTSHGLYPANSMTREVEEVFDPTEAA